MGLLQIMSQDWAIRYESYAAIMEILKSHREGPKIDLKALEARVLSESSGVSKDEPYQIIDGIAIIPVKGVLSKAPSLFERVVYDAVSMIEIKNKINHAVNNNSVEAIILDTDSPGGTVDGTEELSDFIYSLRGSKKIVVFCDGLIASAAYWVGSSADAIYLSSGTAQAGSIGVRTTHYDFSKWNENMGLKVTEVFAGRYKTVGSEDKPLSEEDKDYIQARIDYMYSIFVNAVARNRSVGVDTVLSQMADAKMFIGQQAVDAGLVDGVSTFEGVMEILKSGGAAGDAAFQGNFHQPANGRVLTAVPGAVTGNGKGEFLPPVENTLRTASGVDAEGQITINQENNMLTHEALKKEFAENPDLFEAVKKDILSENAMDEEKKKEEAAKAETDRIQGVYEQMMPGHEKIIVEMMFDGKSTAGDAAIRINAENKKAMSQAQKDFESDLSEGVERVNTPEGEGKNASVKPLEDQAKEAWDNDPKLRAEFNDSFDAYLAYEKAQGKGKVRIKKEANK